MNYIHTATAAPKIYNAANCLSIFINALFSTQDPINIQSGLDSVPYLDMIVLRSMGPLVLVMDGVYPLPPKRCTTIYVCGDYTDLPAEERPALDDQISVERLVHSFFRIYQEEEKGSSPKAFPIGIDDSKLPFALSHQTRFHQWARDMDDYIQALGDNPIPDEQLEDFTNTVYQLLKGESHMHFIFTSDDSKRLAASRMAFKEFLKRALDPDEIIHEFVGLEGLKEMRVTITAAGTDRAHMLWIMQHNELSLDPHTLEIGSTMSATIELGRFGRCFTGLHPEFNEGPVEALVKRFIHNHTSYPNHIYGRQLGLFDNTPYGLNYPNIEKMIHNRDVFFQWAHEVDRADVLWTEDDNVWVDKLDKLLAMPV